MRDDCDSFEVLRWITVWRVADAPKMLRVTIKAAAVISRCFLYTSILDIATDALIALLQGIIRKTERWN